MDLGLRDRVALVTGGSGGIGSAVVRRLAAEGARVAIGYHEERQRAEDLAAALPDALAVRCELGAADGAVAAVLERWGRLDVLVCCAWRAAGWPAPDRDPVELSNAEAWREQVDLNLVGTAQAVQAVLATMRQAGWGRIVLISSGAADGGPGQEAYAAAKAGLHAFNASVAQGLGRFGILSNVVMPGFLEHDRNRAWIPAAVFESWAQGTLTGKLAQVDDVAAMVTMLGSAANGSVTGTVIRVTAGL